MQDRTKYLEEQLNKAKALQKHLFEKGFLITDADINELLNRYPFYGNWDKDIAGKYNIYIYRNVPIFKCDSVNGRFVLIGHAYNPFTMEYREDNILSAIAESYGTDEYFNIISELTGVFFLARIKDDEIEFLLDASGMQYACYGEVNGKQYISSHMRLIGDICNLKTSDYVKRLINYKWYKYMMGNYMPGDITCFDEIKRVIPNTCVSFSKGEYTVERFYPNEKLNMCQTEEEYNTVIEKAAQILRNTMTLIPAKWGGV